MPHLNSLAANATLLDVYRRYPPLARHTLGLAAAAFDLTGEISHAECELLGAYVSALNGCAYCHGIHTEAAAAAGVPRGALEAIGAQSPPAYGGARWEPVFAYVAALTAEPHGVRRDHVVALTQAGWSDDAIAQFAAVCCVFNVLNRLVEGIGLSADAAFYAQAGKRLASVGYAGTARMLGLAD